MVRMPIPESHCQGQTSGPSAPLLPVPLDLTGFQGYRFPATAGGRGSLWLAMRERAPTMTGPVPMRNALVFVASLLLISDAGAVKAPEYPTQAVRPPASMSPLSAPEVATSAPASVPQVVRNRSCAASPWSRADTGARTSRTPERGRSPGTPWGTPSATVGSSGFRWTASCCGTVTRSFNCYSVCS